MTLNFNTRSANVSPTATQHQKLKQKQPQNAHQKTISDGQLLYIARYLHAMQTVAGQTSLMALDAASGISLRLPAHCIDGTIFRYAHAVKKIYQGAEDDRLAYWLNQQGADLETIRKAATTRLCQQVDERADRYDHTGKAVLHSLNKEFSETVQANLLAKTLDCEQVSGNKKFY